MTISYEFTEISELNKMMIIMDFSGGSGEEIGFRTRQIVQSGGADRRLCPTPFHGKDEPDQPPGNQFWIDR